MVGRVDRRIVRCLKVASAQRGVLRRDQATHEGMSRQQIARQVKCGHWKRVHPGVYRVVSAPESWEQRLEAASLWADRGFAFSHHAAAALWGFNRFQKRPVEMTMTHRQRAPENVSIHFTEHLNHREITKRHGFAVTSAARTLLDVSAETNEPDMRASVDQALRCKWTSLEELASVVEWNRGHRGVELLRKLVDEFAGGNGPTESELEARVHDVIDAAGLPRPERQCPVYAGGRLRRLDFKFAGTKVVIEADGYEHHSGIADFERDRARRNGLTARGYVVLQWTWLALNDRPEALLQELLSVLTRAVA
ncbi:MAG: type IV toxin-antitoxin system AbiEi family antitoxin domain-containing protein [Archangium sp.]